MIDSSEQPSRIIFCAKADDNVGRCNTFSGEYNQTPKRSAQVRRPAKTTLVSTDSVSEKCLCRNFQGIEFVDQSSDWLKIRFEREDFLWRPFS
jgi:hypothetical protein